MMQPLTEYLSASQERTIHILAAYIRQYLADQWQPVWQESREELLRIYDSAGEAAYGTYAQRLLRPVQQQIKRAEFLAEPRFPGTLATSREWGPLQARERWMWSVVRPAQGAPIGTLVLRLFHDHSALRLPHAPEIWALDATELPAIVTAVARGTGQ